MQFLGKQYGTRVGSPPENGLAFVVPGKDAVAIGPFQTGGTEPAPGGQQPVGMAQGVSRVGKGGGVIVRGNPWQVAHFGQDLLHHFRAPPKKNTL